MEAFQNKQSKRLLGISKYASNYISSVELGWFPLQNKILLTALKYWLRLKHITNSPLLANALHEAFECKSPWSLGITDILSTFDLTRFDRNSTRENLPRIFKAIKDLLKKDYVNTVKIKSASNPSLKGYILNHSGNSYKCKDYLARINNSTHRNTVTKLRTATHCLATASDIYKTDIANNIKFTCKHCSSGEPEDANHLILHCKNKSLTEPRKNLLKHIPYTVKAKPENITLAILNCSFQNITPKT